MHSRRYPINYPITQLPDYPITRLPDSRSPPSLRRRPPRPPRARVRARRGRTVLAHAYAEPPFRVGRAFELDDAAYVILGCTGPGIFAGDTLRQSVRVASGARVVLVSQSALQAHPSSAEAAASIAHDYAVDADGELCCQWDPVIPFAGARLEQRFDINLDASARLLWGDAIMAGRIRRGEAWRFESLTHELRLSIGGSLMYLERYALAPNDRQIAQRWMAGTACYLATALVHHDRATADGGRGAAIRNRGGCRCRRRSHRAWHDCRADDGARWGAVCPCPGGFSHPGAGRDLWRPRPDPPQVK